MNIEHHFYREVMIVSMPFREGRLVEEGPQEFVDELLAIPDAASQRVAFDMSKVSYLNSTGLGELVRIKDCLMDRNIELILINPTQRVVSLLSMAGIDRFFNIIDDEHKIDA